MKDFKVPVRAEVSAANQVLFDKITSAIGRVPNLFASMAASENALSTYMNLTNAKTSFTAKEKELISLVVSQFNKCNYCLSAHTAIAKLNGFTEEQILEIRQGSASFNPRYDALAKFVKSLIENNGHADEEANSQFTAAGFTNENLVDAIIAIGDKTITNYLFASVQVPVDFPLVEA